MWDGDPLTGLTRIELGALSLAVYLPSLFRTFSKCPFSSPPMPVPGPTPVQSFLGGVGLALPAQALLSLNSRTFGISGFIHGAARGNLEDAMSALGLIAGGFAVAAIEGTKPIIGDSGLLPLAISGLLVGVGAKVRSDSPGVSGHHLTPLCPPLAHR